MGRRSIYVWKLGQVLRAEGGAKRVTDKARRAGIGAIWVKIADGASPYANVRGDMGESFKDLIGRCRAAEIEVWGWHVPHCATASAVREEVGAVEDIQKAFGLAGLIMDAEGGPEFFQGAAAEANAYGEEMRKVADAAGVPLAMSSNDIPRNIENWLPRFNKITAHAELNFPQVYYGASPSVENRLDRAVSGNSHVGASFRPVGAAWIGEGGGCASASACAERAASFIKLCNSRGYDEYSFWHWGGAPLAFWEVLNSTAP